MSTLVVLADVPEPSPSPNPIAGPSWSSPSSESSLQEPMLWLSVC